MCDCIPAAGETPLALLLQSPACEASVPLLEGLVRRGADTNHLTDGTAPLAQVREAAQLSCPCPAPLRLPVMAAAARGSPLALTHPAAPKMLAVEAPSDLAGLHRGPSLPADCACAHADMDVGRRILSVKPTPPTRLAAWLLLLLPC